MEGYADAVDNSAMSYKVRPIKLESTVLLVALIILTLHLARILEIIPRRSIEAMVAGFIFIIVVPLQPLLLMVLLNKYFKNIHLFDARGKAVLAVGCLGCIPAILLLHKLIFG